MSHTIEEFRAHHRVLREHLSQLVPEEDSLPDPAALIQFLEQELLPHAEEEERELYDRIEPHIPPGQATLTMRLDHQAIQQYAAGLRELLTQISAASPQERPQLEKRFWRRAVELAALIRVHLSKEEEAYLPVAEQLESLITLDVRQIPPPQRHPLIFSTFERLTPGQFFILVNDHDPKPLFYQFQAERAGQFTWEYLERGPEVWRVRIGKQA